jgi:hypothetical protein
MILNRRQQRRAGFRFCRHRLNQRECNYGESHAQLKVVTAAVALLFIAPVLAQEMGGATGPGSARGLEPTYNNGYNQGGEFWPARVHGALDGNNS